VKIKPATVRLGSALGNGGFGGGGGFGVGETKLVLTLKFS